MKKREGIEVEGEITETREEYEVEGELPEKREGFKFVCEILEIIIRDKHEIHQEIVNARENGKPVSVEVISELTKEWKEVSKRILGEERKISPEEQAGKKENKTACESLLSDYIKWMECTAKDWTKNRKAARNRVEEIPKNVDDYKKSLGESDTKGMFQSFKSILNAYLATHNAFFLGFSLTIKRIRTLAAYALQRVAT